MKKFAYAAGLALLASACSGGGDADADGDGAISADEARTAMANSDIKPEAGQYKMSMEFVKAEIPGAPKEMMDMLGGSMTNSFEYCLTEEQAQKGFEEALTQGQDDSCTVNKMTVDGGDIDMAMTCNAAGAGEMKMTMNGEVTSTTSDLTMTMSGSVGGMGEGNIEMKVSQERIGDCPA